MLKVVIVIVIISIIVFRPNLVKKFSTWGTNKVASFSEDFGNKEAKSMQINQFNNVTLTGVSILSAFAVSRKYKVPVFVKTLKSNNFIEYTKDKPYNVTDKNNSNYINNNSKFKFTLRKNASGVVQAIQAQQI